MKYQYAERMQHLSSSDVRDLLRATANKDIISIGGGLPAPELFPIEDIKKANEAVLDEMGAAALQYTTTEGFLPLRKWIADRMNRQLGTALGPDNILLTNGSQQALDLAGKVFLNEGDVVLCESPTYLSAISAFKAYGCSFIEAPTDEYGIQVDKLEAILDAAPHVKLIYTIPTFQNPTGITWTKERREGLVKIAKERGILIMEDNPYGELRYDGEEQPTMLSMDHDGGVMYLGTFSKIFCPGYRIGWVAANQEVIEKLVLVKQGADLQCNTFAQMAVYKYVEMFDIDAHVAKIREVYKRRRDLAVRTLEAALPPNVHFTRPEGGLFLWVVLPKDINARHLMPKCMERGVAFVPGGSFFPNGGMENTMRINFSNAQDEKLEKALKIVADVIKESMK